MNKKELISWGIALLYGLTIAGYPLISSLPIILQTEETRVVSIPYRAFILVLSIIIIFSYITGEKRRYKGIFLLPLFVFWLFYILRLLSDTLLFPIYLGGEVSTYYLFIFGVCLIPMLAFLVKVDDHTLKRMFNTTVLIITIACISTLYLSWIGAIAGENESFEIGRMYSETLNPIALGHIGASLTILCGLYLLLNRTQLSLSSTNLFFGLFLILGLFTVGVAASRGPALALIICLMILIFSELQLKNNLKILIFSTLLFTMIYSGAQYIEGELGFKLITRTQEAVEIDETTSSRLQFFADAWNQFLDNPLLGSALEELNTHFYPHNVIIESFMATGIIGGIIFCLLIIISMMAAFQLIRTHSITYSWIGLFYIQYLIGALFSGSLWGSNIMWCLMAAVITLSYQVNQSELLIKSLPRSLKFRQNILLPIKNQQRIPRKVLMIKFSNEFALSKKTVRNIKKRFLK